MTEQCKVEMKERSSKGTCLIYCFLKMAHLKNTEHQKLRTRWPVSALKLHVIDDILALT